MAEIRRLWQGDEIRIDEWVCHGNGSEGEEGARCPIHTFLFPFRGVFRKHLGDESGVATPGTMLYFGQGEEYRTSHPAGEGDGGLLIRFEAEALGWILEEAGRKPLETTVETAVAPASLLVLRQLVGAVRSGQPPGLDIEETALGVLGDVLRVGTADEPGPGRSDTERAHRREVSRVLELCATRYREPLSLADIVRETSYSRFHLCRLFKRCTGVTIHRHVNRLRLAAALESGGSSGELSRLAMRLGFASHSHFTTAFRAEFGAPPSRVLAAMEGSER